MMFLMPPKIDNTVSDETSIAKTEKDSMKQQIDILHNRWSLSVKQLP